MDIFSDTGIENIQHPYQLNLFAGMIYFLKHFKNICIGNIEQIIWYDPAKRFILPSDLYENVRICQSDKSVRFIFGFITLVYEGDSYHQNVYIIDQKDNSVEIFEPHGDNYLTNPDYYNQLKDLFLNKLEIKNFYETTDFCPKLSFQALQVLENKKIPTDPDGFCQAWSIWWIYYRLKNDDRDISRHVLVIEAINQIKGNMTKFIRKYAEFIVKTRSEIIEKMDPNIIEKVNAGTVSFSEITELFDLFKKETEKITKPFKSATKDPYFDPKGKCLKDGCPDDLMCRLSTGRCVKNKFKGETLIIKNNKKYLRHMYDVVDPFPEIIPTLENFSQVYIREHIYNTCGDKLTRDELYLVLFYKKPINGADKIWKNN